MSKNKVRKPTKNLFRFLFYTKNLGYEEILKSFVSEFITRKNFLISSIHICFCSRKDSARLYFPSGILTTFLLVVSSRWHSVSHSIITKLSLVLKRIPEGEIAKKASLRRASRQWMPDIWKFSPNSYVLNICGFQDILISKRESCHDKN